MVLLQEVNGWAWETTGMYDQPIWSYFNCLSWLDYIRIRASGYEIRKIKVQFKFYCYLTAKDFHIHLQQLLWTPFEFIGFVWHFIRVLNVRQRAMFTVGLRTSFLYNIFNINELIASIKCMTNCPKCSWKISNSNEVKINRKNPLFALQIDGLLNVRMCKYSNEWALNYITIISKHQIPINCTHRHNTDTQPHTKIKKGHQFIFKSPITSTNN